MKYKSELIKDIVDTRGHKKSSLHYESKCIGTWIEETKGAYPKLCDYESEWLNYISILDDKGGSEEPEPPIGEFPYIAITDVTNATIDNVVPLAYKSAILKGQTLVNIDSYYDRNDFYNYGADYIDEDGFIQLTARGAWINAHTRNNSLVKPNTKYAIIVDIKENTLDSSTSNALKICTNTDTLDSVWSAINGIEIAGGVTGRLFFTATTSDKVSGVKMLQRAYVGSALKTGHIKYRWMIIEYQEGMENWDIPYFRGMTSVKMPVLTTTGKNLFNDSLLNGNQQIDADGKYVSKNVVVPSKTGDFVIDKGFQEKTVYTFMATVESSSWVNLHIVYTDGTTYSLGGWANNTCYKVIDDSKTIDFITFKSGSSFKVYDIYLEKGGNTAPTYEPYKTNILTVNEDVTLRSNGDVYDELNLLTGRLTQRIGEDGEVLTQEVVKTVELSIQDQDGNTLRKIKPIEGTMHITTSGTPINPTVSLEVPVEAITQNLNSFIEEE